MQLVDDKVDPNEMRNREKINVLTIGKINRINKH